MIDPLEVAPAEDSGAETQDRFRWQHHCTAVDCIAMLRDPSVRRIVCEMHEDYLVDRGEDDRELVSCKTRELTRGAWPLAELCVTGGLAHLFSRWRQLGGVRLRLMTNAALKLGAYEAAAVIAACRAVADGAAFDGDVAKCRDALARALLAARRRRPFEHIPETPKPLRGSPAVPLPAGFAEQVEGFMPVLRVCAELPSRLHIRGHHVEEVMRPALATTGHDPSGAADCYDAIVAIVAIRNVSGPLTGQYASWLTIPGTGSARGTLAALVQARTIHRDDVSAALGNRPDATRRDRPRTTARDRLRIKLMAGAVGETRINSALRLRERWLAHCARIRNDLPGDSQDRDDLEDLVLDIAGDVEAEVATVGSDWGDKMYEALRARLHAEADSLANSIAPTGDLLFGLALDLAAECEVWFSQPFDVEAVLPDRTTTATDGEREGGTQ